ncbi:MAG TPA: hypothetical protein VMN60_05465, partial [Longimicrobiales bacterium]|nr:hypothetical protein [Longimicrobiales bacterium]
SQKPRTIVSAVRVLTSDLLIVLIHVPSENWQDAVARYDTTRVFEGRATILPGYRQQLHDTMIDVIDVRTGSVLARARTAGRAVLTSDGTLYKSTVSDEGVIRVEAYEIVFRGLDAR